MPRKLGNIFQEQQCEELKNSAAKMKAAQSESLDTGREQSLIPLFPAKDLKAREITRLRRQNFLKPEKLFRKVIKRGRMFHKATQSLTKQLDPDGGFKPVRSLVDEKHFRPLCLVQKKKKNAWWQKCPYHKTEFRLQDVLISGDNTPKLDVQDSGQFTIVDQLDGKVEGDFSGTIDLATIELKGTGSIFHARSVKVKKIHICSQRLHSIIEEGKVNMCHDFIKQSKKFQRDLYVITEAIETMEETKFEESSQAEGSIFSEVYIKLRATGRRDIKKTISIPKGSILAFRTKRLLIREGYLGISHYPDDKTATFLVQDGIPIEGQGPEVLENKWQALQREVKKECATFSHLSADLCGKFLKAFVALMRENDLLQELEFQLEQARESTDQARLMADRPELKDLIENLQYSSGAVTIPIVESVLYFLQALDELTDNQLTLLAESVEKKIVSKQLALAECIIVNGSSNKTWEFTVDAHTFTEDELNITGKMFVISGVTVQENGTKLAGTGNFAALSALSALYVALYALSALSTS
ncbi:gasdermin-A isoform X2 [Hemicordylus capensis]|uniref:gasdermin-A isoform X2 n=1 Tax=Hemicordylus capensis TaxID=884348 RepID=UPI0023028A8A|nr:gasdermin-A isoform X2 [Hemicordylus capensis]